MAIGNPVRRAHYRSIAPAQCNGVADWGVFLPPACGGGPMHLNWDRRRIWCVALLALGPGSRSDSLHSPGTRDDGLTIDLASRTSERASASEDPGPRGHVKTGKPHNYQIGTPT